MSRDATPAGDARIARALLHRRVVRLRAALRTPGGALATREVRIVEVLRADGARGFGEASVVDWLGGDDADAGFDEAVRFVTGLADQKTTTALAASLDPRLPPSLRCGVQTALLDAEARSRGVSLARLLGSPGDAVLPVSALVGGADAEASEAGVRGLRARGFAHFKLKVGGDEATDLARLRSMCSAAGHGAALRLDANGAWRADEANARLEAMTREERDHRRDLLSADARSHASTGRGSRIDFVEEPLAASPTRLDDLRALRRLVLVAVDESVRTAADLARVVEADAADVLVLKLERVGGPLPALDLARRAVEAGMRVVFTDSIDSAVGRAAAAHTALAAAAEAGLPPASPATGHREDCEAIGLGGLFLLDDGGEPEPAYEVRGPGLGIQPAPASTTGRELDQA